MSWAQQEDEPPIEQVGEDTDKTSKLEKRDKRRCETLDEAAPPADRS